MPKKVATPPPLEPGGFEGVEWVKPVPVPVKKARKTATKKATPPVSTRVKKDLPAPPITTPPQYRSAREARDLDMARPLPPSSPVVDVVEEVATTPEPEPVVVVEQEAAKAHEADFTLALVCTCYSKPLSLAAPAFRSGLERAATTHNQRDGHEARVVDLDRKA